MAKGQFDMLYSYAGGGGGGGGYDIFLSIDKSISLEEGSEKTTEMIGGWGGGGGLKKIKGKNKEIIIAHSKL